MGPICDLLCVEQGICLSDRLYISWPNNEQLSVAQQSKLGIDIGDICISAIGQADDSCLVSDCVFKLQHLLQLTVQYCSKYHVELVPEKTKLLCYSPSGLESSASYWKLVSPITLANKKIEFSIEAEHVGIVRSVDGNLPNIMARLSSHTKSLMTVLPAGLAKGHLGNPAACLRVELLYGCPVLLSGLAALVLNKAEVGILQHHYKVSLERLQRLHKATPEAVVCFLGGSLPLPAILHLRQLSLLGMISRLGPDNILHRLACSKLSFEKPSSKSWFLQVKSICTQYSLPDPMSTLANPQSKSAYKRLVKSKVIDFWERKLRLDASLLPSLQFFKPQFLSLCRPHPIWSSAGSNPYEVKKACAQARMLSGRYRTCWLSRHWSGDSSGSCTLPACHRDPSPGTLITYCWTASTLLQPGREFSVSGKNTLEINPSFFQLSRSTPVTPPHPSKYSSSWVSPFFLKSPLYPSRLYHWSMILCCT